ncbi:MAG: tetratricopeptide repeat protein [Bryobacterales bacterium]|nr:tetratricopeptide repeat protein [Bryobacterales bacterium]
MSAERWARVAELYEAAQELDSSQRGAFLEEACRGDEELRREVESLLGQEVSRDGALERVARAAAALGDRGQPKVIGRYRILSQLGEGGMGTVYKAEQDHPRRTVALKVIRSGIPAPALLRRFDQESEALGRLQHPGIAQIYEAGAVETAFGRQPYFAMEYIQGRSLTEHALTHRLNHRDKLQLMVRVCDAAHHAHQRGILHRDLKPGNILVDESGQPKILDFGVARILDTPSPHSQLTSAGELVGTPAYMSPEQVANPAGLDARSEVYALGVVLYELMTGHLPVGPGADSLESLRRIREEDPLPLGRFNREFSGDLETITAKALEKDKARRYASATELAADLRRFLENRPIAARPPSAVYRARKFAARHRLLVSAAAVVLLALIGGILASTREAIRANRERQRADTQAAVARAVSEFLQHDLLAQASAEGQATPATQPDPDLKVRTALERAAVRIAGRFGSQPEVEASIRDTIGKTYFELSLYPQAREQQERAVELRQRVLGQSDLGTLSSMRELAGTYFMEARYDDAERLLQHVVETQRRSGRPDNAETLDALNDIAEIAAHGRGDHRRAEALLVDVLARERRILGTEHPSTLVTMNNLALEYSNNDKDSQAQQLYEEALPLMKRVLGPEHPQTLLTMNNLGATYRFVGKYEQASELLTEVLEVRRRLLGEQHRDTLATMNNLALAYTVAGRFDRAEPLIRRALDGRRRLLGQDHPESLSSLATLGDFYRHRRDWPRAEAVIRQVERARRRVLGPEHSATRVSLINLAESILEQRRYAEAEALLREAQKMLDAAGAGNWRHYYGQSMLGASLSGEGRYAEAERFLVAGRERIVERRNGIPAEDRRILELTRHWLVDLYTRWGKPEQAARWRQLPAEN